MHDIYEANTGRWGADVVFLGVNMSGSEDGIGSILADYPDVYIPVLQDDSTTKALWNCGASSHYIYVIDGERNVRYALYSDTEAFSSSGARVIEWIDDVLGNR